jgi:hypothetical protein
MALEVDGKRINIKSYCMRYGPLTLVCIVSVLLSVLVEDFGMPDKLRPIERSETHTALTNSSRREARPQTGSTLMGEMLTTRDREMKHDAR